MSDSLKCVLPVDVRVGLPTSPTATSDSQSAPIDRIVNRPLKGQMDLERPSPHNTLADGRWNLAKLAHDPMSNAHWPPTTIKAKESTNLGPRPTCAMFERLKGPRQTVSRPRPCCPYLPADRLDQRSKFESHPVWVDFKNDRP